MNKHLPFSPRNLRLALALATLALVCVAYGPQLLGVVSVLLTGLIMAFILEPLSALIIKWGVKSRAASVTLSFATVIAALASVVIVLFPPLIDQMKELSRVMSGTVVQLKSLLESLNEFLVQRQLPLIDPSQIDWTWLTTGISGLLSGTTAFASDMIGKISRFGFSLMLAFYFLLYKDSLLLSMELCIPMAARKTALQMISNVVRELRQYLKGQIAIALIVGALASIGLLLIGAPSAVLMGMIIGLFNVIPYFGPLIGAIPAVLMALSKGLYMALLTVCVVFVVQQLDGFLISPRVMNGITGLSPPLVLVAITVGSGLFGIGGMFFAIPVLLIVRICFRVWSTRNEAVVKSPEV